MPEAANQNLRRFKRGRRVAVVVCFAILIGFALHSLSQSGKTTQDSPRAAPSVALDVTR